MNQAEIYLFKILVTGTFLVGLGAFLYWSTKIACDIVDWVFNKLRK